MLHSTQFVVPNQLNWRRVFAGALEFDEDDATGQDQKSVWHADLERLQLPQPPTRSDSLPARPCFKVSFARQDKVRPSPR